MQSIVTCCSKLRNRELATISSLIMVLEHYVGSSTTMLRAEALEFSEPSVMGSNLVCITKFVLILLYLWFFNDVISSPDCNDFVDSAQVTLWKRVLI